MAYTSLTLRQITSQAITIIILILFPLSMLSCNDDGQFTKSPTTTLTLPFDTLITDTAISGTTTSKYSFVIRNRNSKGIKIIKAYLESEGVSGFQVAVDGTNINDPYSHTIEVRGKDSITVYVKFKAKANTSETAQAVSDNICFLLESGTIQKVTLVGYSQGVNTLNNITFDNDTVLKSNKPFHVIGNLNIAQGKTLTIVPGTVMLLSPNSEIIVRGSLKAMGTVDSAVVIRGDRLDHMFANQPYDRIAGQWKGITFTSTSYGNILNHCDIHSGSYGIKCDSSGTDIQKLKVENTIIHNMKGDCITLVNSNVFVGNCQITNALGNCVTIRGGYNHFVHCTIGNFYPFEGSRGKAVYLYNSLNGRKLPLHQALFENCIVSGWSDDELFASFLDDTTAKEYLFRSCLLTTPKVEDETNYPYCIFENTKDSLWGSKNFRNFDLANLVFDFEPDSLSKARNNADISITKKFYPTDRKGRKRLENDGKSDIGCYEFEKNITVR